MKCIVVEIKCSELDFSLTLEKKINEMKEKGYSFKGLGFVFEHSAGSVIARVVAEVVFEGEN